MDTAQSAGFVAVADMVEYFLCYFFGMASFLYWHLFLGTKIKRKLVNLLNGTTYDTYNPRQKNWKNFIMLHFV